MSRGRKYFVAKHDLASFLSWPGVIWRTGEQQFPRGLKKIQVGDRWIAFAYINNEKNRDPAKQVVGFYECISIPTKRTRIPPRPRSLDPRQKWAWVIKGKAIGWQPDYPVTVPSLNEMLGKVKYGPQTLTPIDKEEFDLIRRTVRDLEFDPSRIPLLHRDPRNEQEVVGILLAAHEQLGIEAIDRIRTDFPDLRVKIAGKKGLVHLEVETYSSSFLAHRHDEQMSRRRLRAVDTNEKLPVGVVCWHDNDKTGDVAAKVHRVYELRSLLRGRGRIKWGR